jgi:hypothetical protein
MLPRNDRLVHQIVGLERRVAAAGRETITHADRGHDDLANAAAGAVKLAKYGGYNFWWPLGPDKDAEPPEEPGIAKTGRRRGLFDMPIIAGP